MRVSPIVGLAAVALLAAVDSRADDRHGSRWLGTGTGRLADRALGLPFAWGTPRPRQLSPELPEAGRTARGIFLSPLAIRRRGRQELIATLRAVRLTALVTDLKDERGMIVVPGVQHALDPQRDVLLPDAAGLVRELHAAGIWVVGRIVCFKDGALAEARPDVAPVHRRTGRMWRGHLGVRWTSPYVEAVQDRLIAVAREGEALGFDEVQLDYVRFPVEDEAEDAVWPGQGETLRRFVIARFLERLDAAIGIPISVDVLGMTPFVEGSDGGLGQSIDDMAPHVEVVTPMLYSSAFDESTVATPSFGHRVGAIVGTAVAAARRRIGHVVAVRPFLQAFSSREPEFGLSYIQAQLGAARSRGADGFLFWNPRSEYGTVWESFRQLGAGAARGE